MASAMSSGRPKSAPVSDTQTRSHGRYLPPVCVCQGELVSFLCEARGNGAANATRGTGDERRPSARSPRRRLELLRRDSVRFESIAGRVEGPPAAVHYQRRASDVARSIRCQKVNRPGNLIGPTYASHRDAAPHRHEISIAMMRSPLAAN
jgi:hypothetical protein